MQRAMIICAMFVLVVVLGAGCKLKGLDFRVDELDTNKAVVEKEVEKEDTNK